MISAEQVTFTYPRGGVPALADVGLTARPGEVLGLIGPNGSGKSTMLRALYAALVPHAGLISIEDTPVTSMSPLGVAHRIAVVVQEPASKVPITVAEMVLLGHSPHRSSLQRYTTEDRRIAAEALRRVGARHLGDRSYASLSGGEKQRVLIARTLAQRTDHLLLDEPTNHLDIRYQHEILELVRTLGVTTVVVLHDLNLAARYCDELVLLEGGQVVCTGIPEEVLTPEVLEPVYRIRFCRLTEGDTIQLIFSPAGTATAPRSTAGAGRRTDGRRDGRR